jgi:DNA-binding SARP family transcriptional activator
MLRFCILGTLQIISDDRTFRPRGSLQRRLLLTLLINARKLVLTDSLIEEVWQDQLPARVENALQAHVSRLRQVFRLLEPVAVDSRLVTHPSGYQLLARDEELDSTVFASGLERIKSQVDRDPAVAVGELRDILALWQGPLLGGVIGGPACQAAAVRHGESRLAALELLLDCELQAGNHVRVIGELRELLVQYPFQERFWQQIIIALCRSGRQRDALNIYRDLWHRLAEELGLEPSPAMREYERAIIEQDTELLAAPGMVLSGVRTYATTSGEDWPR